MGISKHMLYNVLCFCSIFYNSSVAVCTSDKRADCNVCQHLAVTHQLFSIDTKEVAPDCSVISSGIPTGVAAVTLVPGLLSQGGPLTTHNGPEAALLV